jgi:hypothetical protein
LLAAALPDELTPLARGRATVFHVVLEVVEHPLAFAVDPQAQRQTDAAGRGFRGSRGFLRRSREVEAAILASRDARY